MVDTVDRSLIAAPLADPSATWAVGHRPLQPALPVLHARGGVCLAFRKDLLTFEEIRELVTCFPSSASTRFDSLRRTPAPQDLPTLVSMLADNPRIHDLAMTTNGILLPEHAQALYDAGLHRSPSASIPFAPNASSA